MIAPFSPTIPAIHPPSKWRLVCWCTAYPWPHRVGFARCTLKEAP